MDSNSVEDHESGGYTGESNDESLTPSPALQEVLGVTETGTCLRHPNCPVLSLQNNRIMSCRVCFSEEKSVGIQQRKSFAAVVNQLQRMSSGESANAKPSEQVAAQEASDSGTATGADKGAADPENLALQQPQTLEFIMKRLSQVQNWMLRQKEKEVMSLQLTISRLEKRVEDQDATLTEQKATIRALRRTIQQDLKIIKTMATQKEKELEASERKEQQHLLSGASGLTSLDDRSHSSSGARLLDSGDEGDEDEDDEDNERLYSSPVRKMEPGRQPVGTNESPDNRYGSPEKTAQNKAQSPPKFRRTSPQRRSFSSPQRTKTPPVRRGGRKKDFLAEGSSMSSQRAPPSRRPPVHTLSTSSLDASVTIPENEVVEGELETDDEASGIFSSTHQRSEYWSDEDLAFATDPTKIFASFRGGLLDIPKSPPPACHNNPKPKLKLKVKLDQDDKMALKLPSMRHLNRNNSNISEASSDGMGGSIPLHLLASQLGTLPSLDHSTHLKSVDGSLPATPVSCADGSSNASGSPDRGSKTKTEPPPPPLSLLGPALDGAEAKAAVSPIKDESGQQMRQGDPSSPGVKAPRSPTITRPPLSTALQDMAGSNPMNSDSIVTATYSVETLDTEVKSETPANDGSEDNAGDKKMVVEVTRASCQDKYGDPGSYTGTILVSQGLPHGQGTMNYESGRVYSGEWSAGLWNGKGSLLNPNGDKYEGEFVFDARHGQGTYKWDNGDIYVGNFSQDKRHGHGKFSFHNGNEYEGEFCDGMFEGFGKYKFAGGSYEGEWKQGRYDGNGELVYSTGGKYTGEFRNSVAHGFGMEITADGQKRRGVWENGQPADL